MKTQFRAALLGLMLGLTANGFFSCGTTVTTVPTAFFVTVFFNPGLGTSSLVFNGFGPNNVLYFPTTRLPMTSDPNLNSPQTVRILMPDALDAVDVNLNVVGIDENDEVVESVTVVATVHKGKEVAVTATLVPLDARLDAGMVSTDSGVRDGGMTQDAGPIVCGCATGCCEPGKTTCAGYTLLDNTQGGGRLPVRQFGCGNAYGFCTRICNSFSASMPSQMCAAGALCKCGSNPACEVGTRCENGQCICDPLSCPGPQLSNPTGSSSPGCCGQVSGKQFCLQALTSAQCGNTGVQCGGCSSNRTCNSRGQCTGPCSAVSDPTHCCAGDGLAEAGFPRCKHALTGSCISCDWVRTSQCGALNNGCQCGDNQNPCSDGYRCIRSSISAPFQCVKNSQ